MGGVLSGSRCHRGGKTLNTAAPAVSLLRGRCDIARPGQPLLLVEDDRAFVIFGAYAFAVAVATSPCHMGGARRWLICPCCRVRRQTLYIERARLACRLCARLRYPTQAMNRRYRAIEKADSIRRRLGWEQGVLRPWGGRPKRMRTRTFERLSRELQELESFLLPDLLAWAERAEKRMGRGH